ncbi:hypothetical protein HDU98_005277 [Podochytrium sp. JEL0797]|nr:hypothetical protein HDU98_005277 [Podochytrium sp. JEL0797]
MYLNACFRSTEWKPIMYRVLEGGDDTAIEACWRVFKTAAPAITYARQQYIAGQAPSGQELVVFDTLLRMGINTAEKLRECVCRGTQQFLAGIPSDQNLSPDTLETARLWVSFLFECVENWYGAPRRLSDFVLGWEDDNDEECDEYDDDEDGEEYDDEEGGEDVEGIRALAIARDGNFVNPGTYASVVRSVYNMLSSSWFLSEPNRRQALEAEEVNVLKRHLRENFHRLIALAGPKVTTTPPQPQQQQYPRVVRITNIPLKWPKVVFCDQRNTGSNKGG